jgi:SAM-dependent methyltransferase
MSSSPDGAAAAMPTDLTRCYLCGSQALELLPRLPGERGVTTDGQLLAVALRKYQCLNCMLLQSDTSSILAETPFSYEDTYDFYGRPFMRAFDNKRYRHYADWVASFLTEHGARRVLEVGCGDGWVLQLLQETYPSVRFHGLEPSVAAVRRANADGLDVCNGSVESNDLAAGSFDFAYCINVLEHVTDPIGFVRGLGVLLKPGGYALIICPHGNVIDPELLFVDHLFSYSGKNLDLIARHAGLSIVVQEQGSGMLYAFQALVVTNAPGACSRGEDRAGTAYCPDETLASARREYFSRWAGLDETLGERLNRARNVICFGAGETTDLLRAYAPTAWGAARALMIDRPADADPDAQPAPRNGLPIHFAEGCSDDAFDRILLGVKPCHQPAIAERLGCVASVRRLSVGTTSFRSCSGEPRHHPQCLDRPATIGGRCLAPNRLRLVAQRPPTPTAGGGGRSGA